MEYNKDCCTAQHLCGDGEGDCDRDDHCAGNLVCMPKICGSSFGDNAECCTHRGKVWYDVLRKDFVYIIHSRLLYIFVYR